MQRQEQIQLQRVTQHTNDIWNRVLFSLELVEYALDEADFPNAYDIDKILLDLPEGPARQQAVSQFHDKDIAERDSFVQLQVRAFRRGIKNAETDATSEMPWLLTDFLEWYAGRANKRMSRVDEYAMGIAKALLTKEFPEVTAALPEMIDDDEMEQHDVNRTLEKWGAASHLVDAREKWVDENSDQAEGSLVEQFTHPRGSAGDGFFLISRRWLATDSKVDSGDAQSIIRDIVLQLEKTDPLMK